MAFARMFGWVINNCRFAFEEMQPKEDLGQYIGIGCTIQFYRPLPGKLPEGIDESQVQKIKGRNFILQPVKGVVKQVSESALWVKTDNPGLICVQKGSDGGWEATNSALDPWGGHPKVII